MMEHDFLVPLVDSLQDLGYVRGKGIGRMGWITFRKICRLEQISTEMHRFRTTQKTQRHSEGPRFNCCKSIYYTLSSTQNASARGKFN